jgi:hypothetical protein
MDYHVPLFTVAFIVVRFHPPPCLWVLSETHTHTHREREREREGEGEGEGEGRQRDLDRQRERDVSGVERAH